MARSLGVLRCEPLVEERPAGRGLELRRRDKADRPHRRRDGVPVGEIVVGTPVEDLLDDRALAVHAVIGGPNPSAVARRDHLHLGHPKLPGDPSARCCHELPGDLRRGRSRRVEPVDRFALVDDDARARLLLLPASAEVVDPHGYRAHVLVRLAGCAHAERGHVDIHRVDALLAEQRVCLDTRRCDHVVLEQAMDEDDVGSEQLVLAGDTLAQDRAVVDDELQVEVGDAHASIAFARRRLAHVAASPSEAK